MNAVLCFPGNMNAQNTEGLDVFNERSERVISQEVTPLDASASACFRGATKACAGCDDVDAGAWACKEGVLEKAFRRRLRPGADKTTPKSRFAVDEGPSSTARRSGPGSPVTIHVGCVGRREGRRAKAGEGATTRVAARPSRQCTRYSVGSSCS